MFYFVVAFIISGAVGGSIMIYSSIRKIMIGSYTDTDDEEDDDVNGFIILTIGSIMVYMAINQLLEIFLIA